MKVSTEIDNNFGYEKITQLVDNIPLTKIELKRRKLRILRELGKTYLKILIKIKA